MPEAVLCWRAVEMGLNRMIIIIRKTAWLFLAGCALLFVADASSASEPQTLPAGITNTQDPKDRPLSPADALKKNTLPAGFEGTLFAGEPGVVEPGAVDFDDRGR